MDDNTQGYHDSNEMFQVSDTKRFLYEGFLAKTEKRIGGPGRLLDVGCAQGEFLVVARERGWDVVGVEPVKELCDVVSKNGFEVICGVTSDVPDDIEPFDLVTYWDVICFIREPKVEMKKVHGLLKYGGEILIRIRQHRVLRFFDAIWSMGFNLVFKKNPVVYHPMNFEPHTFRTLFGEMGLKCKVSNGEMSRSDVYETGKSKRVVSFLKTLLRNTVKAIGFLSGERMILSPTMIIQYWKK